MKKAEPFRVGSAHPPATEHDQPEVPAAIKADIEVREVLMALTATCPDCGHPGIAHGVLPAEHWGWVTDENEQFLHKVPGVRCGVMEIVEIDPDNPEHYAEEQCGCRGHSLWAFAERPAILSPEDEQVRARFNACSKVTP